MGENRTLAQFLISYPVTANWKKLCSDLASDAGTNQLLSWGHFLTLIIAFRGIQTPVNLLREVYTMQKNKQKDKDDIIKNWWIVMTNTNSQHWKNNFSPILIIFGLPLQQIIHHYLFLIVRVFYDVCGKKIFFQQKY